jgi:hypothetical protein
MFESEMSKSDVNLKNSWWRRNLEWSLLLETIEGNLELMNVSFRRAIKEGISIV